MTKKQKQNEVLEAFIYTGNEEEAKKLHSRPNIYIFNPKLSQESDLYKLLFKQIWDENIAGKPDLSFEICAKACEFVGDLELEVIENDDLFYENEFASIYTDERLSYLNMMNQTEISEKLKEYDCDIPTACAVWYDDMVRQVTFILKDYIFDDEK